MEVGFCVEAAANGRRDVQFSPAQIEAELERRKHQHISETSKQKYQRLGRLPIELTTDTEQAFLRSREAALIDSGLI